MALPPLRGALNKHGNAALFTLSSLSKTAVMFAASLVTARVVAPADLGLWNGVALLSTYALFLQAGVINGLSRELPFELGAGDNAEASRLVRTALRFTLLGCTVAGVLGVVAVLAPWTNPVRLSAVAAVAVLIPCTFYQNFLAVTFRSRNSFGALARAQFFTALAMAASIPLLYWWAYPGMLVRIALLALAATALLHRARPFRIASAWDGATFKKLMKTGLPIFTLSYADTTAATFDRLFVLSFAGAEALGYYALGLMAMDAFSVLPQALATYVYPRMTYAWGREGDRRALWRRSWQATAFVVCMMSPLAAAGWVLVPHVVPLLFPRYAAGAPAAQLLLVASVFAGARLGVNALWSMKSWGPIVTYTLIGVGLRTALPLWGVRAHKSAIEGAALGVLAASAAHLAVALVLTYRATHSAQPSCEIL